MMRRLLPTRIPVTPVSHPRITSPRPNVNLKPVPVFELSNTLLFDFKRPS